MPEQIRFLLDEHIDSAVANGLRRRGVDVLTIQDSDRRGLSDADQLAFAKLEGRVIVTFDSDFLAIAQRSKEHGGIVWCPASKHSIGQLIMALMFVNAVLTSEDMQNHIEYL